MQQLNDNDWIEYLSVRNQMSGYSKNISDITFTQRHNIMTSQGTTIYVLKVEGVIVGILTLIIETKIYDNVARIEDVVVDVNHRMCGYGIQMVREAIKIATEKQCYKVIVGTRHELEKFYEKANMYISGPELTLIL
jgi:predicted GNAT family N-acyltransferase